MTKCKVSDTHGNGALVWVPRAALNYVAHTEAGASIRSLARMSGCHASTVSRQVRAFEARRDDVLVDEALRRLGPQVAAYQNGQGAMSGAEAPDAEASALTEQRLNTQAIRVLRRLCEAGAVLAVAPTMEKAVVVRETAEGSTRTAIVDRDIAEAMALNAWIQCDSEGKVSRYRVTAAGRSMLARLLAEQENAALCGEDADELASGARNGSERPLYRRGLRYGVADSPLVLLSRRRDKGGERFLSEALVRAGERLREDFEMSQLGDRKGRNWDAFLNGELQVLTNDQDAGTMASARQRVTSALRDLGPGLGDVALRCCCFLEGLESAEKDMGWSARSGKIVLRIALQRLKRHYDGLGDTAGLMG